MREIAGSNPHIIMAIGEEGNGKHSVKLKSIENYRLSHFVLLGSIVSMLVRFLILIKLPRECQSRSGSMAYHAIDKLHNMSII